MRRKVDLRKAPIRLVATALRHLAPWFPIHGTTPAATSPPMSADSVGSYELRIVAGTDLAARPGSISLSPCGW